MNGACLRGKAREYYESFRDDNKPIVDIIGSTVIFTWHFDRQPEMSARTIDRIYNPQATQQAINNGGKRDERT